MVQSFLEKPDDLVKICWYLLYKTILIFKQKDSVCFNNTFMNIILFEAQEIEKPITVKDRRIQHLKKVIKIPPKELFDAGIIQQTIGKAYYEPINNNEVKIIYQPSLENPSQLWPISIILGIIRPVNIQRIMRDLCTLGVNQIHLVKTEKSEKSYLHSRAYQLERIHQYLIEGAEQAFSPFIPEVFIHQTLKEALFKVKANQKFAFDNYDFKTAWGKVKCKLTSTSLALGPERGWSNHERDLLEEHNYNLCSLGNRILRTETAALAAVTVFLSKINAV